MIKQRHKAIPAVYLLLSQNGRLLLSRRCNTGYCDNLFGLPSWHAEEGESLFAAMVREAKEEIGIEIDPHHLTFVHVRDRNANDGHRIDFFFSCSQFQNALSNCEPEKCSELRWVEDVHKTEEVIPYIKEVCRLVQEQIPYSVENW